MNGGMNGGRRLTGGVLLLAALAIFVLLLAKIRLPTPGAEEAQAVFVAPVPRGDRAILNLIIPYEARRPGLAHYTEHLVYLSAIKGRWGDIDPDSNATTEASSIRYTLTGRGDQLGVLAGVFAPIDVAPREAAGERDIVMREYDLDDANDLRERAIEATAPFLYDGSNLAYSVLGTPAEIDALTLAEARQFQRQTHLAERAILFASGNVTAEQLTAALHESGFPPLAPLSAMAPRQISLGPPAERQFSFPDDSTAAGLMWDKVVTLPRPMAFEQLAADGDLLGDVLESGLPGSLAKPLLYDGIMARSLKASVYPLDERHVEFFLRLEPDSGVSLATLRAALEAAIVEAARGVPAATFQRHHQRTLSGWQPGGGFELGAWMDGYMLRRLVVLRRPASLLTLKAIDETQSLARLNEVAALIAAPGRLAISAMGRDDDP